MPSARSAATSKETEIRSTAVREDSGARLFVHPHKPVAARDEKQSVSVRSKKSPFPPAAKKSPFPPAAKKTVRFRPQQKNSPFPSVSVRCEKKPVSVRSKKTVRFRPFSSAAKKPIRPLRKKNNPSAAKKKSVRCYPLNSNPASSTASRMAVSGAVPVTVRVQAAGLASTAVTPFTLLTDRSTAALQWLQCMPSTR